MTDREALDRFELLRTLADYLESTAKDLSDHGSTTWDYEYNPRLAQIKRAKKFRSMAIETLFGQVQEVQ